LPIKRQNFGGDVIGVTDADERADQQPELGEKPRLLLAKFSLRLT
jgi:hypothetical protein